MSLMDTIEKETKQNAAFRMAVIGAALTVTGALIMSGFVLFAVQNKSATLVFLVINLLVTAIAMSLAVYTNYCVTHGGCNTLATVYGVVYLVSGLLSVIVAISGGMRLKA